MTDLEKLERTIAAANEKLDLAAQQDSESETTARAVHMLRLKLADFKARQEQPTRRRSAA